MNILFLAYEVESNAVAELSKYYNNKGHHCVILNCDFWTFYSNKDFYKIYDQKCDIFYTLEEEYKDLDETKSSKDIDYEFLKSFENKYDFKFNDLIRTDPILYTSTHERDYYNIPPNFIKHKWVELLSKKLENICVENKIDTAVTINNNYFVKNLGYKIFPKLNIKYLTVLPTRIDDYFMVYDNFGIGSPELITNNINNINTHLSDEAQDIIDSVVIKGLPAYKSHLNIVNKNKNNNFLKDLFASMKNSSYLIKTNLLNTFKNKKYKNNYFAPRPLKELLMPYRNDIFRKRSLENSNILKKNFPHDLSYYYYGLHFHPESSLLSYSKYHDEAEWILKICADLDIDQYLVVKENASMLGGRHPSFYKRLSSIPNLIFLHPSVDSIALIKNSIGVIGMAGTLLIEANMLDKPAYVIAKPEYLALSNVYKYSKFNLNNTPTGSKNNIKEYIQLILKNGVKLDMTLILYNPYSKDYNYEKWSSEVMKLTVMLDRFIG